MKLRIRYPKECLGTLSVSLVIALLLMPSLVWSDEAKSGDDQYRRILHESTLNKNGDVEILVREHSYPAGWQAPTHYHEGDLFIYVSEGDFEIRTDKDGKTVYSPGEAVHMAAGTIMDARNASNEKSLKLVIFQIGKPGGPFLVPIE